MKRLITFASSVALAGTIVFAHGGNEHLRGVVTQISAQTITVQTADKGTKTLTLTDKTAVQRSGKPTHLADVQVGDRVVIDVPEKTTKALLIQLGAPAKATPHK